MRRLFIGIFFLSLFNFIRFKFSFCRFVCWLCDCEPWRARGSLSLIIYLFATNDLRAKLTHGTCAGDSTWWLLRLQTSFRKPNGVFCNAVSHLSELKRQPIVIKAYR